MKKLDFRENRNMSMLMDFYELTMSNAYLLDGVGEKIAYFDMFFRKVPEQGGYAIMAGLEQVIEYIESLRFDEKDIEYLRGLNIFNDKFLNYLLNFKFTGSIYAVPEGTLIFPNEPIITVKAPVIEAQLLETMILLTVNHQSLIATKTSRICRAADGKSVLEFGARRAQGYDAAIYGARAAYIGGADGTATTIVGEKLGMPVSGTMAHSWIQFYEDEYEAFKKYAEYYPDNCTLLVDTYSVLKSGIPNAIRVAKEVLEPMGKRLRGVRLDSGDMAYLSIKARKMLDEAGFTDCKIVASNSLDERTITSLFNQGAKIDVFGVGERLITSKSAPVFGGVYKLVAVEEEGNIIPRIKLSENVEKVSNPGYKKVYRIFDKDTNKALADVITMADEVINEREDYVIFDPVFTWKKKTLKNFYVKELQEPIFVDGELVYKNPTLDEIKAHTKAQLDNTWDEIKRFENPHTYYVDLSKKLWDEKNMLIEKLKEK
ncbi:nicotinate phosphoribosyltransferase [Clostridium sp. SHJSY1]|uniref:nicotinate phosphoribosyltransferase n=1 Tax=Clostridium sp. SHJSY1 TaxID=2942483 RepID=UPI0028766150|nr:nicotinate phosphoribosyltransferase [Clostridium sp. SHJSY1]MDS0528029.1 nicotinate phosphoribosyltransferase [Clostridium sp. SHJSY1]